MQVHAPLDATVVVVVVVRQAVRNWIGKPKQANNQHQIPTKTTHFVQKYAPRKTFCAARWFNRGRRCPEGGV